jgi:hypothetical protein
MAQNYTIDVYDSTHTAATDLQNIENNFAVLKSSHSGASTPSNTEAGMLWADIDSGASNELVLKVRDDGDASWFGLLHGDATHIILVYRNTALDGWAIDASASDRVVAVKGGGTYTTGGANAGSWTISGLTNDSQGSHSHAMATSGLETDYDNLKDVVLSGGMLKVTVGTGSQAALPLLTDDTDTYAAHTHTVSSDGTWRVSAAVFTMQYLDM